MIKNNITLEQVEQEVAKKGIEVLYFSSQSLWWSHLESDVEEATAIGNVKLHAFLANRPEELAKAKRFNLPVDPIGGMVTPNFNLDTIETLKLSPDIFGDGGVNTFMASHHQNCFDKDGNHFAYETIEECDKDWKLSGELNLITKT
jgi:hypothetical protein